MLNFKKIFDSDFNNPGTELKNDIQISIVEGAFTSMMGTLIGGVFLTGYAISLGVNYFAIGLLASLPLLSNIVQIFGSYLIDKLDNNRRFCIISIILHRIIWLMIIISPTVLLKLGLFDLRLWIFVALMGVASICISISSVSWTSWMTDLIPQKVRGRFFTRRNTVSGIVSIATILLAGLFIDYWHGLSYNVNFQSYGFIYLFTIGTMAGIIGVFLLYKIRKPKKNSKQHRNFFKNLKLPFKYISFRHFIIFSVCWGFSVSLASPFFSVYMIKIIEIPFTIIGLFGIISALSGIFAMRLLGKFINKYGPKPLLYFCSIGASIIPALWLFATPENYNIIWFINIFSGFFWSGIGIASSSMIMNLAPSEENAVSYAAFSFLTGISGAIAPIIGGYLATIFNNVRLLNMTGLKLLFITSSILRLSTIPLLYRVRTPNNIIIKEIFKRFESWQRYMPIYNMNLFSAVNTNYRGNINILITRAMLNMEKILEEIMDKKEEK
ncbi:MAG: MFS transporter [Bacillota bacterium]